MTDTKQAPELLPCPFCGDKAVLEQCRSVDDGDIFAAYCLGCEVEHRGYTMQATADLWNTRADLAAPQLDVEAHEELERLRIERRLAMNMAERDVQFGDGWLCDYAAQISALNDMIADRIRRILTDATGGGGERDGR